MGMILGNKIMEYKKNLLILVVSLILSGCGGSEQSEVIEPEVIEPEVIEPEVTPTFTSANYFKVNEGEALVGIIMTANDTDTLTINNSNGEFELKNNVLSFNSLPNYEMISDYSLSIIATDLAENQSMQDIRVEIVDIEEVSKDDFVNEWFELTQTDLDFTLLMDKPNLSCFFKSYEEVDVYYTINNKQYAKTFLWEIIDSNIVISYLSGVELGSFDINFKQKSDVFYSNKEDDIFFALTETKTPYYTITPSPILYPKNDIHITDEVLTDNRVDRENITFINQGEALIEGTGWCAGTAEWFEHDKVISCSSSSFASFDEDYISYQFKNFELNNSIYTTIFSEETTGYYTYPNLKIDWNIYQKSSLLVLDNTEYDKLHRFLTLSSKENSQNFRGKFGTSIEKDKEEADVTSVLIDNKNYFDSYFSIKVTTFNGVKVVRFRNPDYDIYDLKSEYFEVDYDKFYEILLQ